MVLPTIKSEYFDACFGRGHVLRGLIREGREQDKEVRVGLDRTGHATATCDAPCRFRVRVPLPFALHAMANLTKEE